MEAGGSLLGKGGEGRGEKERERKGRIDDVRGLPNLQVTRKNGIGERDGGTGQVRYRDTQRERRRERRVARSQTK